jgi:site-specific DNA recombinase
LPVIAGPKGVEPGQIRDKFCLSFRGNPRHTPVRRSQAFGYSLAIGSVTDPARRRNLHRKKKQSKSDAERLRLELIEKTSREIDAIAEEFHGQLSRKKAASIGALYARYSTRFQDSIADQVRTLFEEALRKNIFIPRENVFYDIAARGYSSRRPGLMALREAITSKRMGVLLIFATNRLFRKTYKALQFVEEEVVEEGIRCIFVKTRIDTADGERWRTMLNIHATMDEFVIGMYGDHIRAAHEGLFLRGMVCTKLSVGYTGEPIEGEFTKNKKPRKRVVVDANASLYVKLIFRWFVNEHVPIDEIVRRLNSDPNAPTPVDSLTGMWSHDALRRLLKNAAYRGHWEYGKTESKWLSKKDYVRQFPRSEPLKSGQFEELRIISDETWFTAQRLLAENRKKAGRKPKDSKRVSRPQLLNGLFWCPEHDQPLYVSGTFGCAMQCAFCRATEKSERTLVSTLNRKLALLITCSKIADLVCADDDLVAMVVSACQTEAERAQKPDPVALENGKAEEARLRRQIKVTLETLGDSNDEEQLARDVVRGLRNRLAEVAAKIRQFESGLASQIRTPTENDVRELLAGLHETLTRAAEARDGEDAAAAREILNSITGGRIPLFQMGERKAKRGWLQGRFRVHLLQTFVSKCTGAPANHIDDEGINVTIDYQRPASFEEEAKSAWGMHTNGETNKTIAQALHCGRSKVTRLLQHAAKQNGEVMEDGRKRGRLAALENSPPLYRRIADDVQNLWDEGLLMEQIADSLNCDRTTVKKIISDWHTSRGLPVPDGRTRRKALACKQSKPRKSA